MSTHIVLHTVGTCGFVVAGELDAERMLEILDCRERRRDLDRREDVFDDGVPPRSMRAK